MQAQHSFKQQLEKIKLFLAAQEVIRIHIDSFPEGSGNQSSSLNLMKKLRQLGFEGKFECIYFSMQNNLNRNKIASLFGLPQDFSPLYYDKETQSELIDATIHWKYLIEAKVKHYTLALTGGELPFHRDAYHAGKINDDLYLKLEKRFTNAQHDLFATDGYARIQCWLGKVTNKNSPLVEITMKNEKKEGIVQNAGKQFFTMPVETLQDAFNYIHHSPEASQLLNRKPGLLTFMTGLENEKFYTLPMYGWPIQSHEKNPSKPNLFYRSILRFIIGARTAQLQEEAKLQDKPLIIPVFYDYESEANTINRIIRFSDWGKDTNIPNEFQSFFKEYCTELDLVNNFKIASLSNPSSIKIIETLAPGDVLLLSMGNLPQVLFNGLYVTGNEGILAHVYEGENTRNAILSGSDKPFLRSLKWDFPDYGYGPRDKMLARSYEQYDSTGEFIFKYEWVAKFIIDSRRKNSAVSQYFVWLYKEARRPENDRIMNILNMTIDMLEENGLWSNKTVSLVSHENLSTTQRVYQFFNKMSYSFIEGLSKKLDETEKAVLQYAVDVVKQCPATFPPNQVDFVSKVPSSSCAYGFFASPTNQCWPQPTALLPNSPFLTLPP